MTNPSILDLTMLQRPSQSHTSTKLPKPRKRFLRRFLIPVVIIGGFFCLLIIAVGRQLLPHHDVTFIPVIVTQSRSVESGTPLFQTAGWVEPRPQAVSVAALAAGIISELLVVEGELVEQDQPIARLLPQDAELTLRQSKAMLALREGELARAQAELKASKSRVEQPVHLQVSLAEANSMLAKAKTELARTPFLIESARAAEAFSKVNLEGKRSVQASLPLRHVQQAENDYIAANATLKELLDRSPFLQKEVDALEQKVEGVQTQLRLLIEENRQWEEAEAKVQSAMATVDDAKVQIEQAQLNLNRMEVKAPIRGRILRLLVSRGTRVMGLETTAAQNTSTVAQMYEPTYLQVRADVRLEDVPKVSNGQSVLIQTASSEGAIQGRVLQSTSSANVQKNTLEVKVELIDPPQSVCPEMLVTATFLSTEKYDEGRQTLNNHRILIPKQLIDSSDTGDFVWIVGTDRTAIHRRISIARSNSSELSEVGDGLNLTDKLIVQGRESLTGGESLRIIAEDMSLGAMR